MAHYEKLSKTQLESELRRLESENESESAQGEHYLRHELQVYEIELQIQNRELREKQHELEQTLDRYADLYDFAPVGYMSVNRSSIVCQCNLTASKLLGKPRAELLDKPLTMHMVKSYKPAFYKAVSQTLQTGEESNLELQLKIDDGLIKDVELQMAAPNPDKAEVRMTMLDITRRKRAETEARQHREALLHAGRLSALGEMASGIAHEISQPIGAISSYSRALCNMLRLGQQDESELADIVEKIVAQSERTGSILERVRTFARRQEPQRNRQNVHDLVKEAVALVDPTLKDSGVEVKIHRHGTIADPELDRVQIIQVLVNLLQNAIEAMHDTPQPEREIRVEIEMPDDDSVQLAVRDNGCGIPADQKKQLFMPFFSGRPGGLGLGLSLNDSIVQAHGGHLWIEDNQPRGSIFHIRLPIEGGG